jgi:uncharacterized protein (TIGR03067 family)
MRSRAFAVLAVGLWVVLPIRGDDDAKKELKKLEGTWVTVSADLDGNSINELVKGLAFTVKGDAISITGSEEILKLYSKGTLKLYADTKPRSLDFKVGGGDNAGKVVEAIYEFTKDDELKMCANLLGKERPTAFESKEGTGNLLIVVKREKPCQ